MECDIQTIFAIPELAAFESSLNVIIPPEEQRVILEIARGGGEVYEGERPDIEALYRRGILNILPDESAVKPRYRLAGFYTRLGVFVITELAAWRSLDRAARKEIDDWYFDSYYQRLHISAEKPATEDAVFTLEETIDFIDKEPREPYLAPCDCRSLASGLNEPRCDKPLEVCVSFRNGPNTSAHRGITKRITKEAAKEIILRADREALIHRVNSGTICNCCIDCCYLSRAQKRRNEKIDFYNNPNAAAWPLQTKKVRFSEPACVQCGQCIERCPLKLFSLRDGELRNDASRCIGCALCVTGCPSGALSLETLSEKECL
jgi:Pyruvate/2-oxoacid:ferredoxin oxidoreductase delta subunit